MLENKDLILILILLFNFHAGISTNLDIPDTESWLAS